MEEIKAFNKQKRCRHGEMLFNINDQYIGKSLDLYGEYSEGEAALFDQIIQEGQVVIDAGANIGSHTVFFAQKVGRGGFVHAFEPQRLVFQVLCANMALNSFSQVYCHPMALGAERGVVQVPQIVPWQEYNFGGLALGQSEAGDIVSRVPLDELGLAACHFIKVDVEGMEMDVLKGAQGILQKFQPVLYVENDRPEKSDILLQYLDGLGYEMYWHLPLLYNPDNYLGNTENVFGNIGSHNMLCLPRTQRHNLNGFQKIEIPK